jgi:hypothetical protein
MPSQFVFSAVVTSHNIIIVHHKLINVPNIAFFTSPIPLHIAAMVILYGQMSKCENISRHTAVEDIWLALDMLPKWRWRWERKDVAGGHPFISKLAERVMDVSLASVNISNKLLLIPEPEWEEEARSPHSSKSAQLSPTSPKITSPYGAGSNIVYGPQPHPHLNNGQMNGNGEMAEVPSTLFYPIYPEIVPSGGGHPITPGSHSEYSSLLAAAASQQTPDTYMQEERNEAAPAWTTGNMVRTPEQQVLLLTPHQQSPHSRQMPGYAIPPSWKNHRPCLVSLLCWLLFSFLVLGNRLCFCILYVL